MFIFDYFRAFLVFNTKNWPFLGIINMVYTLYLDKEKELCLMYVSSESSCDKLSKIYKSINKNYRKTPLLVPLIGSFSNAYIFVFYGPIIQCKTGFNTGINLKFFNTFWFTLQIDPMQSYLNLKIGLPPVLKAGSSGKSKKRPFLNFFLHVSFL